MSTDRPLMDLRKSTGSRHKDNWSMRQPGRISALPRGLGRGPVARLATAARPAPGALRNAAPGCTCRLRHQLPYQPSAGRQIGSPRHRCWLLRPASTCAPSSTATPASGHVAVHIRSAMPSPRRRASICEVQNSVSPSMLAPVLKRQACGNRDHITRLWFMEHLPSNACSAGKVKNRRDSEASCLVSWPKRDERAGISVGSPAMAAQRQRRCRQCWQRWICRRWINAARSAAWDWRRMPAARTVRSSTSTSTSRSGSIAA